MTQLRKYRSVLVSMTALAILPLACERADKNVVVPEEEDGAGNGDGDTATPMGGNVGDGDGDGDGDDTGSGGGSGGSFPVPGSGGGLNLPNPVLTTCTTMGGAGNMSLLIDDFEDGDDRASGNGLNGHWESHWDIKDCAEEEGPECLTNGTQSPLGGIHNPEDTWTDNAFVAGRNGSANALNMTGSGFVKWGSGQGLYFAQDSSDEVCAFDGSAYAGITFWARGSVELTTPGEENIATQPKEVEHNKLKVHVVELDVVPNEVGGKCDQETQDCWDSPRCRVTVEADWKQYVLPFADMTRDGWSKLDSGALTLDELYQLVFEVSEYQTYDIEIDDVEFYTAGNAPGASDCN